MKTLSIVTSLVSVLLCTNTALALQPYCQPGYKFTTTEGKEYQLDLSKLNKEFSINQTESTPPSITNVITQINICDKLPPKPDNSKDNEFCAPNSYVCRRTLITKDDKEIVYTVQTIASDNNKKLNPVFKPIDSKADPSDTGFDYSITLEGGEYNKIPQSAVITLECDRSQSRNDDPSNPEIVSYTNNVLSLHWKTVFACATKAGEKAPDNNDGDKKENGNSGNDGEVKKGMSGIGIFFTIIMVLGAVYFVAGAIYNFKMYNARGLDLIPHRDFWLDLPYLIKDLIAHVIDSVMSRRRGSGGYVSV
ncbi:autophagy-related protein 27 [Mycotypha africana]|uniref:autophagy-related protein 27 n=1 Tax=Mycotypha africana TaxID=64632 RepID=UPI0023010FF4|nr:autophagy-related protein 27 [Mycotypha africana]KAI8987485.1 autophagy-related protein 27 [Mycotypha africana]